jgi:hypothetical protein
VITVVVLAAGLVVGAAPAAAGTAPAPLEVDAGATVAPDRYVVVLKDRPHTRTTTASWPAVRRAKARGVQVEDELRYAVAGFIATMTKAQLAAVRRDPSVASVTVDTEARRAPVVEPASVSAASTAMTNWGLDRIDQRQLPMDGRFDFRSTGLGVNVYVIGTGIRASHSEFGGRVGSGYATTGNPYDTCDGHGTHVGAIAAGATLGVAREAVVVPVKVATCGNRAFKSGLARGVDWVTGQTLDLGRTTVAHLGPYYQEVNLPRDAIQNAVSAGVLIVLNQYDLESNSCAGLPEMPGVITVGSSNQQDLRVPGSPDGSCIDVYSPGWDVTSAWSGSDFDTRAMSGTSVAAAFVAGVAALYLQNHARRTPDEVRAWIIDNATQFIIRNTQFGARRLLNSWNAIGSNYAVWATDTSEIPVPGDFNGDGRDDLALVGGAGWTTVPVAFSNGDGTFTVTNHASPTFALWASNPTARPVAGDFNGDGRDDLALAGGYGWNTVVVGASDGSGGFGEQYHYLGSFVNWAAEHNVGLSAGDFNGDGRDDLALTGGVGWTTVPVAFSTGTSFSVTNWESRGIASWAGVTNARTLVGDFNGDGRDDLALSGGAGWATIPLGVSNADGTFAFAAQDVGPFAIWASEPGVKAVAGDFNGDGRADVALTGGSYWTTVPLAYSQGGGLFTVGNPVTAGVPYWGREHWLVRMAAGDFSGDGLADLALTGSDDWNFVGVARSQRDGTFNVTAHPIW